MNDVMGLQPPIPKRSSNCSRVNGPFGEPLDKIILGKIPNLIGITGLGLAHESVDKPRRNLAVEIIEDAITALGLDLAGKLRVHEVADDPEPARESHRLRSVGPAQKRREECH